MSKRIDYEKLQKALEHWAVDGWEYEYSTGSTKEQGGNHRLRWYRINDVDETQGRLKQFLKQEYDITLSSASLRKHLDQHDRWERDTKRQRKIGYNYLTDEELEERKREQEEFERQKEETKKALELLKDYGFDASLWSATTISIS